MFYFHLLIINDEYSGLLVSMPSLHGDSNPGSPAFGHLPLPKKVDAYRCSGLIDAHLQQAEGVINNLSSLSNDYKLSSFNASLGVAQMFAF